MNLSALLKMRQKKKMLNFDFQILNLFLKENIDFLQNARIQKIQQPTRQELILWLRNLGESKKFYININPKFFHVCLLSADGEAKRMFKIPKSPHMFCMLLRKYLESAKIAKVIQPEGERILEFYFETYNELGEKIYLCLAVELMGKHSNIILYNYDTNVIIGCAHNVGSDKSRERELIGGLPYTYPSKINGKIFSGLSDLLPKNASANDFIDNYFANLQQEEKLKSIKSNLLTTTKAKLKKADSSIEKLKKQAGAKEKTDIYKKYGDLILANLFSGKDFSPSIEVFDLETENHLKIKLDRTKTLKENANEYYKLYKKSKTAHLKTDEMAKLLEKEREYLEQLLYSIERAETIDELVEIKEEEIEPSKQKAKIKKEINLLTVQKAPFTIYIGKNNKQNDYIVSKLARAEDLWFHTHNCAGSHVLLRAESGQIMSDEIIFECAKLAKEYSSAKLSSKVGVVYTKAKYLKKPPSANLGYVTYKNEKEIIID